MYGKVSHEEGDSTDTLERLEKKGRWPRRRWESHHTCTACGEADRLQERCRACGRPGGSRACVLAQQPELDPNSCGELLKDLNKGRVKSEKHSRSLLLRGYLREKNWQGQPGLRGEEKKAENGASPTLQAGKTEKELSQGREKSSGRKMMEEAQRRALLEKEGVSHRRGGVGNVLPLTEIWSGRTETGRAAEEPQNDDGTNSREKRSLSEKPKAIEKASHRCGIFFGEGGWVASPFTSARNQGRLRNGIWRVDNFPLPASLPCHPPFSPGERGAVSDTPLAGSEVSPATG